MPHDGQIIPFNAVTSSVSIGWSQAGHSARTVFILILYFGGGRESPAVCKCSRPIGAVG
jgi:hypothetical protein